MVTAGSHHCHHHLWCQVLLWHYACSILYQGCSVVKLVISGCCFVLLFASSDDCQQNEGFGGAGWGGCGDGHGGGVSNRNFYGQAL